MPKFDQLLCRRSPHLLCYWRGREYVIENYAMGVRALAPPITANVLGFFDDWRPIGSLLAVNPPEARATLRLIVTRLVRHSLLQRSDRGVPAREQLMDAWTPWNPSAGFFHATTRDTNFFDMNTQVRRLRAKSRTEPMPDPIKRYDGAATYALPEPTAGGEFPSVLDARRTWRQFSAAAIDLEAFATLLGLTAGVRRWAHVRGEGKVALKTSPSGGARHANELYVLVRRIKGLPAGLYHYVADAHVLELIDGRASSRAISKYLPKQPWYEPAAAVVFFAACFSRELWRYAYPRAYRAVLIEAGHLCQTFCLTATWLGLAPFCTMALADSAIDQVLKLDGISESTLYAAGVGARPADSDPPRRLKGAPLSALTRAEVRRFPGRIAPSKRR